MPAVLVLLLLGLNRSISVYITQDGENGATTVHEEVGKVDAF